jgi:hypothetical protein
MYAGLGEKISRIGSSLSEKKTVGGIAQVCPEAGGRFLKKPLLQNLQSPT